MKNRSEDCVLAFQLSKDQKKQLTISKAVPEINISPVTDVVSGSRHFVTVTLNSYRSPVYDILLKFENLQVIVTGRKRILSVTHMPIRAGQ